MIFERLVRGIEYSLDARVSRMTVSIVAMIPMAIAVAFAIAAATYYSTGLYGPVIGNLVLAGVFLTIAVLAIPYERQRRREIAQLAAVRTAALDENSAPELFDTAQMARLPEALMANAKALAPELVGVLLRNAPKNVPLLLGAGIGLFLAQRIVDALNRTDKA